MQENEKEGPPPHVVARFEAIGATWLALNECNGTAPKIAMRVYREDYVSAVQRECHAELFGMLESVRVPFAEEWVSLDERTLEMTLVTLDEGDDKKDKKKMAEKRRELDNNLVIVAGYGKRQPFLGLLHHSKESTSNLSTIWRVDDAVADLVSVLGSKSPTVERIRNGQRYARSACNAIVVGYVGDVLAALTSSQLARGDGDGELHLPLLRALSTGQCAHVDWNHVRAERLQHLNPSQFQALDGLTRNIELIRGPPGTGKSTLIDALVGECADDDTAVCVTAVQNRACEALAIKFARSGTPFVAVGTRMSPATAPWTLAAQVERDASVVAAMTLRDARAALLQRVRGRIAERTARFYRPLHPTEASFDSFRSEARERRTRQLMAAPTAAVQATVAYEQWDKDRRRRDLGWDERTTRRELEKVIDQYMRGLDPWRRAAEAIARAVMPEAHAFRNVVQVELDAAEYNLQKRRTVVAERIAESARALLCTTATVGVALRRNADELKPLVSRLHTLVCDEAGTLADRHILPVVSAAPVRRMVLVGDPAQLTCFSYLRGRTPISVMERLIGEGVGTSMLTIQYRMPLSLCSVVSDCFYDGTLETAPRAVADVGTPVIFLSAPGGRAETSDQRKKGSLLNREEAQVIQRELRRIFLKHGDDAEVAVLTTYAAQRNLIQDMLKETGERANVVCITADAAQGQEWDFVIYSHVASDPQRLGFTTNRNRLCVAFSRAKRQLTAIANPCVLARIPELAALRAAAFQDSEEVRRIVQARVDDGQNTIAIAGDAFKVCCVCYDPIGRSVGFLECGAPDTNRTHTMCPSCADGHVRASLEVEGFNGKLHCPCAPETAGGCVAPAFAAADIARVVPEATFEAYHRATVQLEERRVARVLEEDMEKRLLQRIDALVLVGQGGAGGGAGEVPDQRAINQAAAHLIENVLTLRCPHCALAFVDFDACAALRCRCGQRFCALCLEKAANDEQNHAHVVACAWNPSLDRGEASVFVTEDEFKQAQRARQDVLVDQYLFDTFEIGSFQAEAVRAAIMPHWA